MIAVLRADARCLPLPDASVDLVVTSPPYFGLRSYTDGGAHYDGQIGSEATPQEWLANLVACTAEWVRVLKPSGSIFVNLGDKYVADNRGSGVDVKRGQAKYAPAGPQGFLGREMGRRKSLLGLPWRYAIACTDQLGLILRRDIVWAKPNGLPESVTDRCRSSHEYVFHMVKQPRYYAAVDAIREPTDDIGRKGKSMRAGPLIGNHGSSGQDGNGMRMAEVYNNPLGKLPGSVWDIPSQPLQVPAHLGVDHFAAFPMELPRRCILGWSPPGVCTVCGEGRRPVVDRSEKVLHRPSGADRVGVRMAAVSHSERERSNCGNVLTAHRITGYACACAQPDAPTTPALVLDPFAGTGTTMLVASALGRTGVGVDRSMDYARLARWRTNDPGERARAMQVPKPPPVPDGQAALFAL
jgi:DNA modification methylase